MKEERIDIEEGGDGEEDAELEESMEVVPDVPDWMNGGGGEDDNEDEDGYFQSVHVEGETSLQGNATPFKMF